MNCRPVYEKFRKDAPRDPRVKGSTRREKLVMPIHFLELAPVADIHVRSATIPINKHWA